MQYPTKMLINHLRHKREQYGAGTTNHPAKKKAVAANRSKLASVHKHYRKEAGRKYNLRLTRQGFKNS